MKKKVAGRIGATILAASIVMSMAIPVMAATTYVPVAGTSCTFNKNLIMDAGDTIPNVTFAFTIARVIDIREGFPKFMRVSPEGLALFLVEFVRVIREGCS